MSAASAEEKYKPNETKMMVAVIQSFKDGPPENSLIDFEKVAAKVGMTTGSARETWRKLKNKLAAEDTGDGDSTAAGTGTPAAQANGGKKVTPASKRKKAADAEGEDNQTPTKPKRGRKKNVVDEVKAGVSGADAGGESGYVEATSLEMGSGGQEGDEADELV